MLLKFEKIDGGVEMGRYKTSHNMEPFIGGLGGWFKKSTIEDKETGKKGEGRVWDYKSYKEADKKALEDFKKKK